MEPVDGFTVETSGDQVILTLIDRYGFGEQYWFSRIDALRLGTTLLAHSYYQPEDRPATFRGSQGLA